ncbi:glycosyltransferase family 2 protein [Thalassotalea marina]|uniref:Glycosyltransferase 2-like domain-containing protein n=1 Tax=Thalassotalea marina TaxID=1673741 RepID=A0A919BJB4_9GAMM|nr:glycosyltransferase family 2 protein [Thalassotalea marina]GHF92948.1 hypothetical protein GCM10017161_21450 [Thalassotalea marina]
MAISRHLSKYLNQYAEPETAILTEFPQALCYPNVVVIPAYKEHVAFLSQFAEQSTFTSPTLVILVINQPDDLTETTKQQDLYNHCLSLGDIRWNRQAFTLVNIKNSVCDILVIDKFNQGLPRKKGVGLARKIGADCACQLIKQGNITSSWIHSTDADATLPKDYFEATKSMDKGDVAGCYNFYHHSDDESVHQANAQYELSLRYYVAGLKYANSPYSFFTIGSVLSFSAQAYANVRGFPKRSAGEDFYLLNKLAKLGRVVTFDKVAIKLQARTSDRVPFGTGPAVEKILASKALGELYYYYHPGVFEELKSTLVHVKALYQQREQLTSWLNGLSTASCNALLSLDIEKFVYAHQACNQEQFERQFTVWFDAFRTLKFIHHLREHGFADMPLTKAIDMAGFEVI